MSELETVKHRLIKWISKLDDEMVLRQIDYFRIRQKSGFDQLSKEDQDAINEGLLQLNEGNYINYADARERINLKLKKSD